MDKLIKVNDVNINNYDIDKAVQVIREESHKNDYISLEFESSYKMSLWYKCPHCSYLNCNIRHKCDTSSTAVTKFTPWVSTDSEDCSISNDIVLICQVCGNCSQWNEHRSDESFK
jgi:hypothetical protein